MSKLYSIQESTLIDIGDALRSKYGEKRPGTIQVPCVISKTSTATGPDAMGTAISSVYSVVRIPSATKIEVNLYYSTQNFAKVYVASGEYKSNIPKDIMYQGGSPSNIAETQLTFEDTDVITFYWECSLPGLGGLGYYAECIGYDADGNPIEVEGCSYIEGEVEVKNTYSSADVATAIEGLEMALPEEAFLITGNCSYMFSYDSWNWFINNYGDKITTKDITDMSNMFLFSQELEDIPFDINLSSSSSTNMISVFNQCNKLKHIPNIDCKRTASQYADMSNFFAYCYELPAVPYLYNASPSAMTSMFTSCYNLREIPDDYFDTWIFSRLNSYNYAGLNGIFRDCYSLRKLPVKLFRYLESNIVSSPYSCLYYYLGNCSTLDEIVDLPVSIVTMTNNMFSNSFQYCYRLKNITFATNEDGSPKTANWKSQTIDLTYDVGWINTKNSTSMNPSNMEMWAKQGKIIGYNSGITMDKCVYDNTTYQTLKNDPDWFCIGSQTLETNYCRYNHDSAVETINSLPDTSAYLATAGGTNTIKFRGISGNGTDGGAINTLTEEEIAVAAAKGWTVSLS